MHKYDKLAAKVDKAHEKYLASQERKKDKLWDYLHAFISMVVEIQLNENAKAYLAHKDEIVQISMLAVLEKGPERFRKGRAKYSTYCYAIAKNKTMSYVGKQYKEHTELLRDFEANGNIDSFLRLKDPQLICEIKEAQEKTFQTFLDLVSCVMNSPKKPYQIVSFCFSNLLVHKYRPDTTVAGSPDWAFTELEERCVNEGADIFVDEMNAWMEGEYWRWGETQLEARASKMDEKIIGEMVFGEEFTLKDFENWSLRIRKSLRSQLIEKEVERHEKESFDGFGL